MTCSPFDLRDYFLKELPDPQQRQVEAHVKACQPCREELDRLRLTEAALFSLGDEEIPQRIAFVSDKVFEPSPWRRWLAAFWGSAARLGFASAAMLSAAIVVYALHPAGQPVVAFTHLPGSAQVRTISESEIQSRIDAAVTRMESRHTEENKSLVAELESMRKNMAETADILAMYQAKNSVQRYQNVHYVGTHAQEFK